jgi:pimeloyl-ACP methyl ester carboxylesterase
VLARVRGPIVALQAGDDADGGRARALAASSTARVAAGRDPIRVEVFERDGHNLMRYRPDAVSAAILSIAEPSR